MWNRLKIALRWLRGEEDVHLYEGPEFVDVDRIKGRTAHELTMDATRRMLGSVTLDEARKARPAVDDKARSFEVHMGAIFKDFVEPRLLRLVVAQEELIARGSDEMRQLHSDVRDQIVYGRGSINGIMVVYEEFKEAYDAYMSRGKDGEPFDPHKLFPELYPESTNNDIDQSKRSA